jgi:hypothetical protein
MPDSLETPSERTLVEAAFKATNARWLQAIIVRIQIAVRDNDDRLQAAATSNLAAFLPDTNTLALEPISTEPKFMEPISPASFPGRKTKWPLIVPLYLFFQNQF